MKRSWVVACLLVAAFVLMSCAQPAPTAAPAPAPTKAEAQPTQASTAPVDPIKVAAEMADKASRGEAAEYQGKSGKTLGVVMPQFDNDGFRATYIGALSQAIEDDVSVITLDAHLSVEKQLSMIEDLITKKVDAIVFVPVDSAALSTGVNKANAANIPVVCMDRSVTEGDAYLVESDNVAHGAAAADLMLAALEKAGIAPADSKILELLGDQATSAGVERHEGFVNRAEELGLNIVTALPTNWDNAKANAAVMDGFQAHPEINAIYSASGCAMYAGIESALKSLGKLTKVGDPAHIVVVDIDGCPISMDAIRNGYLDADAAQQLLVMGSTAAKTAVELADGKAPADKTIRLAPDPITQENVEDAKHWANAL